MKKFLYIALFIVTLTEVRAQQREQYSQYIMNNYLINPAVTGGYTFGNARLGYRKQWVGFQDNANGKKTNVGPRTMFATFHGPIQHPENQRGRRKKQYHHGIGGYLYTDKTGPIAYNGVFGTYAYHQKLDRKTTLSFGVSGGVKEFKIYGEELHFVQNSVDDLIGDYTQTKLIPDMNIGTWIHNDHFFGGLSVNQLLNNRLSIENPMEVDNKANLKYHYFLTAGWIFQINRLWYVSPSAMVKYVSPAPVQFDLNLRLMFSDFIWAGISYRNEDAVSLVVEYLYKNTFEIGYAFDYTISEIKNYSSNSHEIIVGVRFGDKKRKVICPAKFW